MLLTEISPTDAKIYLILCTLIRPNADAPHHPGPPQNPRSPRQPRPPYQSKIAALAAAKKEAPGVNPGLGGALN